MRDPDLMQRADRAAGALEEAWERWRAMHGLGSEPLPPVSSYVGYSLEEPWGQPRVVFGLRADEAELLASLLDGHDCVGPIYAEVSARPDRRRQATGPSAAPSRPYSVPPQAPAPDADQMQSAGYGPNPVPDEPRPAGHDDESQSGGARGDGGQDDSVGDYPAHQAGRGAEPTDEDEAGPPGVEPDTPQDSEEAAPDPYAPLTPLPDFADIRRGPDEHANGDPAESVATRAAGGPVEVPTQGPGYRGPRYQGSPPRYDAGSGRRPARVSGDSDVADEEADVGEHAPVAKPSRTSRRRTNRT